LIEAEAEAEAGPAAIELMSLLPLSRKRDKDSTREQANG